MTIDPRKPGDRLYVRRLAAAKVRGGDAAIGRWLDRHLPRALAPVRWSYPLRHEWVLDVGRRHFQLCFGGWMLVPYLLRRPLSFMADGVDAVLLLPGPVGVAWGRRP